MSIRVNFSFDKLCECYFLLITMPDDITELVRSFGVVVIVNVVVVLVALAFVSNEEFVAVSL